MKDKKIGKYLDLAREQKSDGDTSRSWRARNVPQGLEKETGGIENQRKC